MLFVSKYRHNTVSIQSEVKDVVQIDGVLQARIVKPEIIVQFTESTPMSTKEARAAIRLFKERWGEHALGAQPAIHEGVMSDGTNRKYDASDPIVRLGAFRTESITDPELRAFHEKKLMEPGSGYNTDYVLVEAGGLSKPWPAYDEVGQGAALSIPKTVKDLGIDPDHVLEYELATKNRPGVVEGLRKIILERQEASLDQRSYEVVVA